MKAHLETVYWPSYTFRSGTASDRGCHVCHVACEYLRPPNPLSLMPSHLLHRRAQSGCVLERKDRMHHYWPPTKKAVGKYTCLSPYQSVILSNLFSYHTKQIKLLCQCLPWCWWWWWWAPYPCLALRSRCVKLPWTPRPWASPVCGTSSSPRPGSTSPRRWWAARCSSCTSPLFVLASPGTTGTWTGGSSPRTSGRTCGRTTWSLARTSGRDREDTPAGPWRRDYVNGALRRIDGEALLCNSMAWSI